MGSLLWSFLADFCRLAASKVGALLTRLSGAQPPDNS